MSQIVPAQPGWRVVSYYRKEGGKKLAVHVSAVAVWVEQENGRILPATRRQGGFVLASEDRDVLALLEPGEKFVLAHWTAMAHENEGDKIRLAEYRAEAKSQRH